MITYSTKKVDVNPGGNWNSAKDWFPRITVNQETKEMTIEVFNSVGYQKKASVETTECHVDIDNDSAFVRGEVHVSNWVNHVCGGDQKFCFAVFVGDSGHVYIHRAPATKGWMSAKPSEIKKRLRKLGIGADNVYQQGDYLLKPANGKVFSDNEFKHEFNGSGHHKFEFSVLRCKNQVWIQEPVNMVHHAVDGIQHPTITIPAGKYIMGTTANSLSHDNRRD